MAKGEYRYWNNKQYQNNIARKSKKSVLRGAVLVAIILGIIKIL